MKFACDGTNSSSELAERARVKPESARVDLARLLDVFGVVQRRERAGLRHGVDVERLADFFERGNEVGMPDAVANPQTGEAVNLRERPHQKQVRFGAVPDFRQQVERFVQELDVGLVQRQQDVRRARR